MLRAPGRNRAVVAGTAVGLVALAVVLLTLPAETSRPRRRSRDSTFAAPPAGSRAGTTTSGHTVTGRTWRPGSGDNRAAATATSSTAASACRHHRTNRNDRRDAVAAGRIAQVDGRLVPRRRLTVASGRHILAVTVAGYAPHADTVQLKPGEVFTWSPRLVAIPLPKVVAAPAPPPVSKPPADGGRRGSADDVACRQDMNSASWLGAYGSCTKAARGWQRYGSPFGRVAVPARQRCSAQRRQRRAGTADPASRRCRVDVPARV